MSQRIGSTEELFKRNGFFKTSEHDTSASRYPTGHGMRFIRSHALAHWLWSPLSSISSIQM